MEPPDGRRPNGWTSGRSQAAARFLAFYAAPLFVAVLVWARIRLGSLESLTPAECSTDAVVTFLAFARFVFGAVLPFSGHMLFLSYALLTARGACGFRLLAVVLLVETTVFKLWIWQDTTSWALGLALGVLAALLVWRVPARLATP